jgi:hypothetical protein
MYLARAVNEDTVLRLCIRVNKAVKLPSVEFFAPMLAPVPRLTVLVLSSLAQVTDGNATKLVGDVLFNDVFGNRVQ